KPLADDRFVLTRIGRALVHGLANIDPIVEHLIQIAFVDQLAALAYNGFCPERAHQRSGRADPAETFENHPNRRCLGFIDDELAVLDVVAERNEPAHPHALLARGRELVADALANYLTFE